jgi:hypothetical protein
MFVDRFLEKCLVEEGDSSSISWGEDSGLPVNSLQTLARSSDNSLFSVEEGNDHEQQTFDLYSSFPFTRVEDNQDYATLLETLALATSSPQLSLEYIQQFASELGIYVRSEVDSNDQVDALPLVLDCSVAETLKQSTDEVCPICLEGLLRLQKVQKLPCSHRMHVRCCKRFFRTPGVKPVCPCCRFDMNTLSQDQTQQKGMTC